MSRYTSKITRQVGATSTEYLVGITTPWMLGFGAGTDGLRLLDEIQGKTGNYRHKVCWRTAEVVTDIPDAWNYSANVHSTDGVINTEDFTPTAGKLWVQGGLAVSASSASGEALASLQAGVAGAGAIVASGSFDVDPDLNTSQAAYFQVGEMFAVQGTSNLMFAVVISGVNGTLTWQPAVRYLNRADAPFGWNDLWSGQSPNANIRTNSGAQGITPGGNMCGQAGIKITSTTARGSFRVIVAAY